MVERNFCLLMKMMTETSMPLLNWIGSVNEVFMNSKCLSEGDDRWPEYNMEPGMTVNYTTIKYAMSRKHVEVAFSMINLFT